MNKFFAFSTTLLCSLTVTNLITKPALADHTNDGYYICNNSRVTHSFTLIDIDYNARKNYSLQPQECWEYWEYEQIEFYDNFNNLKRYSLREHERYSFQYKSDGAVDLVKQ